jgi:hypothetical protein
MKLVELNLDPDRRTLRQFGFIAFAIFGLLGALVLWKGKILGIDLGTAARPVAYTLWGVGILSALFSLVAPRANRFLFLGLIVVTYPIGFVMSYVLMGAIFFLVILPVGLVFRLIGRDPLHRKLDPRAETYWVPHRKAENVERYFRQY